MKQWIKKAGIRAIRTVAQTAIGLLPASLTLSQVDLRVVVGTSMLAGILSLLTSLKGLPEIKDGE